MQELKKCLRSIQLKYSHLFIIYNTKIIVEPEIKLFQSYTTVVFPRKILILKLPVIPLNGGFFNDNKSAYSEFDFNSSSNPVITTSLFDVSHFSTPGITSLLIG